MRCLTVKSLCEYYNYPNEVREQLQAVINPLAEHSIRSMILTGSSSRGELSYRRTGHGKLQLLSDYEFVGVTQEHVENAYISDLRAYWADLEMRFGLGSPLFHIDVSLASMSALRRLPPIVRTFELRDTGIVIFGENVLTSGPRITLDRLDFRELNEVLLWRLWAALLYFPWSLLTDGPASSDPVDQQYLFVLYRNALDLTTWTLPYEGVLISGFRQRVAYVRDNWSSMSLGHFLCDAWPDWLDECLRAKFSFEFSRPLLEVYTVFLNQMERALSFLACGGKLHLVSSDNLLNSLRHGSHRWFSDLRVRRKGYEVLIMGRRFRTPARFGRWLLQAKYGLFVAAAYSLHRAAQAKLNGQCQLANDWLDEARQDCIKLNGWRVVHSQRRLDTSFSMEWRQVRQELAEFLMVYIRSVGQQRSHIIRHL